MKKIKIIIIISSILFLSGCTLDYNVQINKDKSVTEKILVTEKYLVMDTYSDDANEFFTNYYDAMCESDKSLTGYTIKQKEISNKEATYEFEKKFDTVNEYLKSKSLTKLFTNVETTSKENNLLVTMTGFSEIFRGNNQDLNLIVKEPLNVKMKSDYLLKETNANKKNILKGEYEWNFNSKTKYPSIEFTLTNTLNIFSMYRVFIIIGIVIILLAGIVTLGVKIYKKSLKSNEL